MEEQIARPSAIQQRIATLKAEHPQSEVVYFTKHRSSPDSVPKPNIPLQLPQRYRLLFERDKRIQEIFYALYQQIGVKNLAFYVLKTQKNNTVSYFNIMPGKTLGQIYDAYSYNNYLALIYHVGHLKTRKLSNIQRRVLRILVIALMIYLFTTFLEYSGYWYDSVQQTPSFTPLDQQN